jgi:alpha-tubulin suppressor-like RCC1 family protein
MATRRRIGPWADNKHGQLGDGNAGYGKNRSAPIRIGTASDWQAVAVGGHHSLVLKTDGSLWAWGANGFGRLGDGTQDNRHQPIWVAGD